jgi:hypothetical protein
VTLLSIIVPSNRVGGLDVLCAGIREQTFRDFELLLVDELGVRRAVQIAPQVRDVKVTCDISHFQRVSAMRWGNYMASLNTARGIARGDRLLFWSDYTCPHPETLATHARFHEQHPDAVMLGGIEYTELPRLHPDFPLEYGWYAMGHDVANHRDETYATWLDDKRRHELYEEWRLNYERDLDSGRLDRFMWYVFEKPITSFADVAGLRVFNHDRRDTSPFLNLKNDSIPRSLLEKIGGFDERADGCHGHQDSITARQLKKIGAEFVSVPENPVKLLDPHGIAIIRRMDRDDTSNLKLYEAAS